MIWFDDEKPRRPGEPKAQSRRKSDQDAGTPPSDRSRPAADSGDSLPVPDGPRPANGEPSGQKS